MLARMETAYLGILRVVILIVATIALIVAICALIGVAKPLSRTISSSTSATEHSGTLGEFIAEKKASLAPAGSQASVPVSPTAAPVNADVKAAANEVHDYLQGTDASGNTTIQLEKILTSTANDIPDDQTEAYFASLHKLADQLKISTGKKLNGEGLNQLLDWHKAQFQKAESDIAAQHARDAAKLMIMLYVAGASFLFFILIVFTFLFVKIERSLRLVRTIKVEDHYA